MAIIPRLLFYSVSVTFKEFEDAEGSKHPAVINSSILTWVPWSDLLPTSTVAMLDTSALWLQADQLIVVMANAEMGRDERAEKVFLTLPLQVAGLTRYEIHGWQESSEVTRVHGLQ
ncbi:hypothetical protein HCBG_03621 [Histoplasma capsulatum G186AR]|uniref:Uncharacterized protein n=1 Tax=Ajellomyces capsulatus (strain G186AR / H82 / ATCC MYA-2454 / RMSCC 2432) TaxID=447093 RepID=C0NKE1_AJECG|nr:uncharacterized protein HCBG_03621 [Histoplasma capsulatum G186AR]EEH08332.1 hypothetical protein HCBG_03621 [Histoplasma capsulatum G186AR]